MRKDATESKTYCSSSEKQKQKNLEDKKIMGLRHESFPGGSKNLSAIQEILIQSPAQEDPLQYPCLKNAMDRGAWQATVHGIEKSRHD